MSALARFYFTAIILREFKKKYGDIGVFGKRIYHAKNVPFLLSATILAGNGRASCKLMSHYLDQTAPIYATYLKPYLSPHKRKQWILSGMVLAITCRDCTFMAGTVPNLYSRCLWPKTPLLERH